MKKAKRKTSAKEPKVVPHKEPGFYLLWNPRSDKPPRVRYPSEEEGDRVANVMVAQNNEEFILLQAVRSYRPGPPKVVPIPKAPRRAPQRRAVVGSKEVPEGPHPLTGTWKTYGEWRKEGWQVRSGEKGQRFPEPRQFGLGHHYVTKFHDGQVDRRELPSRP